MASSGRLATVLKALSLTLPLLLPACAGGLTDAEEERLAQVSAETEPGDPYEGLNREMLISNLRFYYGFLRPVAQVYVDVVPDVVRGGVSNLIANLSGPRIFINDMLQGEITRASETAGRFLINTTLGIGGFFDVARDLGIPRHDEDFGQTLAVYGVGGDPYLVLPGFGPTNPRDLLGTAVDLAIDPVNHFFFPFMLVSRYMGWRFDRAVGNMSQVDHAVRTSLDFYVTVRSLYAQNREFNISNETPGAGSDIFSPIFVNPDAPSETE